MNQSMCSAVMGAQRVVLACAVFVTDSHGGTMVVSLQCEVCSARFHAVRLEARCRYH